jgi:hypothetical protein
MNDEERTRDMPENEDSPAPLSDEPELSIESTLEPEAPIEVIAAAVVEDETAVDLPDDEPFAATAPPADDALADNLPEDEPFAVYAETAEADVNYGLMGQDVDIDAALAAVASLTDLAAEREAQEDASQPSARRRSTAPSFVPPEPVVLRRGSSASLIPALILIVSGVLLTFATTSGAAIPTEWVAFGALAAVALLLLGYWLSARRWARGSLFFALVLLLSGAAFYIMTQPGGPGANGAPLLVIATGGAFLLTGIAVRPPMRGVILPGLLMMIGGLAALALTLRWIDLPLLPLAVQYGWIAGIVVLALWLMALVFRRRA